MAKITSIKQQNKRSLPLRGKDRVNVYLDESGILRRVGVSVYCLTIVNLKFAQEIDNFVVKIEKNSDIPPFHWREHNWKIKSKFLGEILKIENWNCILIVISNGTYSYSLFEELLSKALQGIEIDSLYIDGKKHKAYVNEVKRSLKTLGIKVGSLKFVRHQTKGALRISDAVAGLARLNYDGKIKGQAKVSFGRFLKKKITTQILSGY